MKPSFNRIFFLAPFICGSVSPWLEATSLTGVGYVQLEGDSSDPQPSATEGAKFIWSPSQNYLFVGYTAVNPSFSSNSVTLLGGTTNSDSIAIGGSAGEYGVAVGTGARASSSVAIGRGSNALGGSSIAISTINDDANYKAEALNTGAIAIGSWSYATAIFATAVGGKSTRALGDLSNAFGAHAYAVGYRATALGYGSGAIADYSLAAGANVSSYAYGSVAVGHYNKSNIRRDGVTVIPSTAHALDPLFTVGNGTSSQNSNTFTLYRDAVARFEGAVQIKAGSGYLTLQPGGTTNRTLILPDADGALLANTSTLAAANLTGTVPTGSLPAAVTQLGATVELDSNETTGNLPWSRISNKPTNLAGYLPNGAVDAEGRIMNAIRILPQGDIPMFGATP